MVSLFSMGGGGAEEGAGGGEEGAEEGAEERASQRELHTDDDLVI